MCNQYTTQMQKPSHSKQRSSVATFCAEETVKFSYPSDKTWKHQMTWLIQSGEWTHSEVKLMMSLLHKLAEATRTHKSKACVFTWHVRKHTTTRLLDHPYFRWTYLLLISLIGQVYPIKWKICLDNFFKIQNLPMISHVKDKCFRTQCTTERRIKH